MCGKGRWFLSHSSPPDCSRAMSAFRGVEARQAPLPPAPFSFWRHCGSPLDETCRGLRSMTKPVASLGMLPAHCIWSDHLRCVRCFIPTSLHSGVWFSSRHSGQRLHSDELDVLRSQHYCWPEGIRCTFASRQHCRVVEAYKQYGAVLTFALLSRCATRAASRKSATTAPGCRDQPLGMGTVSPLGRRRPGNLGGQGPRDKPTAPRLAARARFQNTR